LPSIVAKTVLLSLPLAPVIDTVAPVADDVSPMSMSMSLDEPTQTTDAVAVPQLELLPPLSQLKSMLLLYLLQRMYLYRLHH